MQRLIEALGALEAMLPDAPIERLAAAAAEVRAAVPDGDPDVAAMADGVVAVLAAAGEDADRDVLAMQVQGDLEGIRLLAGIPAAAAAPEPVGLPAWVDAAMLAEFHDAQRNGLAEVEELFLDPGHLGEAEQARVARLLHTLKGEAGTVGLQPIEELYHALEDRLEQASPYADAADDVLAVKDWVLSAVPRLVAGEPPPPGREALISRLREARPAERAPSPADTAPPPPTTTVPQDAEMIALFGEFHDEAVESLVQADEILVSVEGGRVEAASVDTLFRVFHTIKGLAGFLDLGEIGSLAHAAESLLGEAREDLATLSEHRLDLLLRATTMTRSLLESVRIAVASGAPPVPVPGFQDLYQRLLVARTERNAARAAPKPSFSAAPEAAPAEPAEVGNHAANVQDTIKVDLGRVDNLVETIGELVVIDAMVSNSADLARSMSALARQQLVQLSKIVRDLQRQGLALRMVPLRGVFQKMNRLVRDLSRRSGKPIRLELSGQDAEMDRSLAERLGDPLVHMMRNAADHGVESVAERVAAGKPETATLRLSAYHEGGNIIIELSDDGRGLSREAILKKAVDRGLVHDGSQLSDREVFELIFLPGFSTAAKVTELSGRGVGMDVVKRTVEELRGRVQISSEPGKGTTFKLVLPLTLAIIDGMLLVVGSRRYVLPTLSILESMRPQRSQLHRFAGGGLVLDIRGAQLRLVDLGALLGVPSASSGDPTSGFVVVVDGLSGRFGLLVDDLIGQQQVVIKQIDPGVNRNGLFSGAAILSDGQVGLILNPSALGADEGNARATLMLEAG